MTHLQEQVTLPFLSLMLQQLHIISLEMLMELSSFEFLPQCCGSELPVSGHQAAILEWIFRLYKYSETYIVYFSCSFPFLQVVFCSLPVMPVRKWAHWKNEFHFLKKCLSENGCMHRPEHFHSASLWGGALSIRYFTNCWNFTVSTCKTH